MTQEIERDHRAYSGWVQQVAVEAARSLLAADRVAHHPISWWQGDVLSEYGKRLSVGSSFNLSDGHANQPSVIGQYRIIAMSVAPEGYFTVVAHAWSAVGTQIETISPNMLVKSAKTWGVAKDDQVADSGLRELGVPE